MVRKTWREVLPMGRIIAMANQKGGVGKTTSAISIAASLGHLGERTLLIDADPQGNATSGVGVEKKDIGRSFYDALIGNAKLGDTVIRTAFSNLYVSPCDIDLVGAEIELVGLSDRESQFSKAIGPIAQEYDYIIVDCPPSLGLITVNVLSASDSVVVPLQCEYFALEGLSQLVDTIKKIRASYNGRLEIEGVILTMYDGRTNLALQVAAEIKKYFGNKVYRAPVPRSVRLGEAPSYGEPILYYDRHSKCADAYMSIARDIINVSRETSGRA
jgi:chromosome partitioning protein